MLTRIVFIVSIINAVASVLGPLNLPALFGWTVAAIAWLVIIIEHEGE